MATVDLPALTSTDRAPPPLPPPLAWANQRAAHAEGGRTKAGRWLETRTHSDTQDIKVETELMNINEAEQTAAETAPKLNHN